MKTLILFLALAQPVKPPVHKLFKLWLFVPKTEDIYIKVYPPEWIYDQNCEPVGGHDHYLFNQVEETVEFKRCEVFI